MAFEIRVCLNPQCGMRYSMEQGQTAGRRCPNCKSETALEGKPFGQMEVPESPRQVPGPVIEVMLDNIRSAWNVGSIFRAADGAGVRHIHLCGVSPRPDQVKVAKTALGSEKTVRWTYHANGEHACREALERGCRVWALEGGPRAQPLLGILGPNMQGPILLVVGNEVCGVDPGILALCERVLYLPMLGLKGSLNVAVAFGIAIYTLRFYRGVTG